MGCAPWPMAGGRTPWRLYFVWVWKYKQHNSCISFLYSMPMLCFIWLSKVILQQMAKIWTGHDGKHLQITYLPEWWQNIIFKLKAFGDDNLTLYRTTNFLPFQIQSIGKWQFYIWWKWQKVLQIGYKTLWEKEKLLVTSNFFLFPQFSKDLNCRHV